MKNHSFDEVKLKFEKFLSLIRNVLTCENEINIIQNKLRRHFNTTTSDYLCSNEFISSLNHIQNIFIENNKSTKYFTLLASFDEQLKKHSIKLSKSNSLSTQIFKCSSSMTTNIANISVNETVITTVPVNLSKSTIEYETSIGDVQETINHLLDKCCNILSESTLSKPASLDNIISIRTHSTNDSRHQRKIIKLERRLHRLSRIIRELEEKDMSLDEMAHCDLYVVESNLKKQACEMHTKLAKLKSQSSSIERIIHQPIILNESDIGHTLIQKDLQEMVNQSKHFPSFSDVLDTVEKANNKYKLNLNDEVRKNFAEKSFKIIGKEIKNRRMADFQDIMYSRLPEDFNIEKDDPALNNAEIEKVLTENNREAVIKTEKIFEEFSKIEPDPEGEINIESTEDESANENNDKDEFENENNKQNESSIENNEQEEPQMTIESHEIQYDIVDIVTATSPDPIIQNLSESNSIETTVEISLNDRALTILSTASLPIKKTTHNRESEIYNNIQSSSITQKESDVETLIPRRKQNLIGNEIIYNLYKQRLTNNVSSVSQPVATKRQSTRNTEYSNVKKSKQQQQQSEIIVLD
ncbi:unnamed protein product [Rotaria sordida]|uniref:Daxx histone-binding domain-containing protein n=1 Tax=Rotaria sordida TaxID=392033 RepID=A0A818M466_9BILA|nr:unnamed protein product [Rotaria sordida]CAF3586501.1 unnamed protein product [Rotaria sordida]